MRKLVKDEIKTRIDKELENLINGYLLSNPQLSISQLIRDAITYYLNQDIQDRELTALNVQRLIKQVGNLKDTVRLLMELISFYIKSWMVYVQDIPAELKNAAWKKGLIRFERFMEGFKASLISNSDIIQKLITTFLENGGNAEDETKD